ncbi:archease [Candidatus Woesearchaeota archaeon]|nr:archease [Candidatus Woesearchaeota archaeon]
MKYEFLEHTSDAKFKAYGRNLEECFANAAEAMTSVMTDPEKVEGKITKSVQIKGKDLKQLLLNFLEELLFLLDTENFIIHKVSAIQITPKGKEYFLSATLSGDKVDDKYEIETGIKAVTYMDMEVKENYVQVVVDI